MLIRYKIFTKCRISCIFYLSKYMQWLTNKTKQNSRWSVAEHVLHVAEYEQVIYAFCTIAPVPDLIHTPFIEEAHFSHSNFHAIVLWKLLLDGVLERAQLVRIFLPVHSNWCSFGDNHTWREPTWYWAMKIRFGIKAKFPVKRRLRCLRKRPYAETGQFLFLNIVRLSFRKYIVRSSVCRRFCRISRDWISITKTNWYCT